MTYILSLLILVPLVGAVVAWFVGTSQRAAKLIALGFSLIETTLATLLLIGFINPGWGFLLLFPSPRAAPRRRFLSPRPPSFGVFRGPRHYPVFLLDGLRGWPKPPIRGL